MVTWQRLKSWKIKRLLLEGEMIPRGFGIAYREWNHPRAVCYPVPLNWLVWAAREAWFRIIQGASVDARMEIWQRGFEAGKELREDWIAMVRETEYSRGRMDVMRESAQAVERALKERRFL